MQLELEPSPSGVNVDRYREYAKSDPNVALALSGWQPSGMRLRMGSTSHPPSEQGCLSLPCGLCKADSLFIGLTDPPEENSTRILKELLLRNRLVVYPVIFGVAVFLFFLFGVWNVGRFRSLEFAAMRGDSYGYANALFSSLAFAGVIVYSVKTQYGSSRTSYSGSS